MSDTNSKLVSGWSVGSTRCNDNNEFVMVSVLDGSETAVIGIDPEDAERFAMALLMQAKAVKESRHE